MLEIFKKNTKEDGNTKKSNFPEKYQKIVNEIQDKISVIIGDCEKIEQKEKEEIKFLPYTEKGIEVLKYISEASNGPIIRRFLSDCFEYLDNKPNKSMDDVEIKELFNFRNHIFSSQRIIWEISEDEDKILEEMEKFKKTTESIILNNGDSDLVIIDRFYENIKKLSLNLKEISAFLEKNIK